MCAHVFVAGKVQGVGYRAAIEAAAAELKLNGWVRNLPDGRVESVFEGSPAQIEEIIRRCYEGSPYASVQSVTVEYETPEGLQGFRITR